jgi:hypothetical protein
LPPILLAFVILVIFSFNSTITKKKKCNWALIHFRALFSGL